MPNTACFQLNVVFLNFDHVNIYKKKFTNIMFFWRLHDANIKDKIKTSQTP
jgi:hypothetical protein